MSELTKNKELKAFRFQIFLAVGIVSIAWLVYLLDFAFNLNLNQFGLKPKQAIGLWGIFTYPWLHGGMEHLVSNSFPGIVLLTSLFVFHPKNSLKVLSILYFTSGIILWLIGALGSNHIGASGIVYGLAFYLFTAGIKVGERNTIALSFFIILWYGSMIWGIFPFSVEPGTSWEGHLAGAVTGIALAFFLFDKPPVEAKQFQLEEKDEDDVPFFEKHPLH